MKIKLNLFQKILLSSLLFHFCFILFSPKGEVKERKKLEKIRLTLAPAKKKKEQDLSKDNDKDKKQIVQTHKQEKLIDPSPSEKSRFLSDVTQKVQKETRAQKIAPMVDASGSQNSKKSSEQKEQQKVVEEKVDLSRLGVAQVAPYRVAIKKNKRKLVKEEQKSSKESPSSRQASSNDYLEEIPLGDLTVLNTTEYKHFGFYDRIRKKLEQFWGVSIQEKAKKIFQSGRRLASNEHYITALQIYLDSKGGIIKVKIVSSSGNRDLDEAAINSFNRAGPFPNPPQDILVNGVAILEWGFVVKS